MSGSFVVSSGQTSSGLVLQSGSELHVENGGTVIDTTADGGSCIFVSAGGVAMSTTVDMSARFFLSGSASVTDILAGGSENVTGTQTDLTDGGSVTVGITGGSASIQTATILTGANLDVTAGGLLTDAAIDGTVLLGGAGASGLDNAVQAGGLLIMYGGTTTGTDVLSGGSATVEGLLPNDVQRGVVNGGTFDGLVNVGYGGAVQDVTVGAGGILLVLPDMSNYQSGGTASATAVHVQSGGFVIYDAAASVTGLVADKGAKVVTSGVAIITSGKATLHTTVRGGSLGSGTTEYVLAGGTAVHATVSGGAQDVLGGVASNTIVSASGEDAPYGSPYGLVVANGGTTQGALILSGGIAVANTGATLNATTVASGGDLSADSGTLLTGLTIDSGYADIAGTLRTAVLSGGSLKIDRGSAIDTTVDRGLFDIHDGTAMTTILSGVGAKLVLSAGNAKAIGTIVDSGAMVVVSNMTADLSSTTLQAGGQIDLTKFVYQAGASASLDSHDILTISAGGATTALSLVGNYAGATFLLAADKKGGTIVGVSSAASGGFATIAEEAGSAIAGTSDRGLWLPTVPNGGNAAAVPVAPLLAGGTLLHLESSEATMALHLINPR